MARSRKTAKNQGTRFETCIVTGLVELLGDDRIERRRLSGSADRGDIAGVRLPDGRRVVIECKDGAGQLKAGPWYGEAQLERDNDGAALGVVAAKRNGVGYSTPGQQWVLMTLADFATLILSPAAAAWDEGKHAGALEANTLHAGDFSHSPPRNPYRPKEDPDA